MYAAPGSSRSGPVARQVPWSCDNQPRPDPSQNPFQDARPSLNRTSSTSSAPVMFTKQCIELSRTAPAIVSPARPESHQAHGAFTPTSSAFYSLRHIADSTADNTLFSTIPGLRRRRPPTQLVWRIDYEPLSQSDVSSSTPSSPTSLFSAPAIVIPSISRTAPFTPSGETSPTTSFSTNPHDRDEPLKSSPTTVTLKDVDILVSLEKSSKFCKRRGQCSGCGKVGADYPRCSKCGDKWCSRDCRLHGPGGDGKRHICEPTRTPTPDLPKDTSIRI